MMMYSDDVFRAGGIYIVGSDWTIELILARYVFLLRISHYVVLWN